MIEKIKEENKNKVVNYICPRFRFDTNLQPSTGDKKEKLIQIRDELYIREIWIHSKRKMIRLLKR